MAAKISWHRYGAKLHHCHPACIRCCVESTSGIFSTMLANGTQPGSQLEGQSATPQIILAAGTQGSGSLQQLLIPVSAGGGASSSSAAGGGGGGSIQQLISVSVPVGAATATGQMQLLAPPGGQFINVANAPQLNVAMPSPGPCQLRLLLCTGCLQLLEMLEISCNAPGKFDN